ncbi:MAG TPA: extracellular solute-binding protein [Streptosporangiaceae bacterium]|nr:extracellular solute-binding protein [Streptosporangiaceae bacterium]
MNRRLVASLAIGAAALFAAAGCGSSGSSGGSGNGSTTLNFFGADYGTGPANTTTKYWDAIATAFHKANPSITVNVQTVNWTDFPNKVQTLVQNKQFPDILEGDTAPQFAQSHLLYKTSQVLSPTVLSNILPKFLKDTDYQGTAYGIPFTTSTRALYYNKKIFTAAGISSPPTTWAQLQADAAKIKSKGFIGYGLPLGSEEAQAEALMWFLGNGGGYLNTSGKYDINSQANMQTLQFLSQLTKTGDTQPSPGTTDRKDVWAQFAQGKIGMVGGQPALIPIIQQAGVLTSSDYSTANFPGRTGPLASTLGVHDDVVAFNTGGHQAAIKKFLDFAYQNKYQLQFANEYGLLPATQSAATAMSSNPMFAAFFKNIPDSVNYPSDPNWTTVENQIKTTLGQAISGNPQQILNAIQQTATSGG